MHVGFHSESWFLNCRLQSGADSDSGNGSEGQDGGFYRFCAELDLFCVINLLALMAETVETNQTIAPFKEKVEGERNTTCEVAGKAKLELGKKRCARR